MQQLIDTIGQGFESWAGRFGRPAELARRHLVVMHWREDDAYREGSRIRPRL
jgi:hypothetical protein